MSMKAIANIYTRKQLLAQAARVSGGSPYTSTALDLANVLENKIEFEVEGWTDGSHAIKLQDSPDNTTFTDVSSTYLVNSLTTIAGTAQQSATQSISYIGAQRYVQAIITSTSTTTGAVIGVSAQVKYRKLN